MAYAERAFYYGQKRAVDKLWQKFCRKNCENEVYRAAVPYFVHRDDMAKIAPVWKEYILLMRGASAFRSMCTDSTFLSTIVLSHCFRHRDV